MSGRYTMSRCERNGESDLYRIDDLDQALRLRDEKAKEDGRPHTEVLYRVTDSEDPERGDAEWCEEECGRGAFFSEGDTLCDLCRQGIEEEEGAA